MTQTELNNKISTLETSINNTESALSYAKQMLRISETSHHSATLAAESVNPGDEANKNLKRAKQQLDKWTEKVAGLQNTLDQLNQELATYKNTKTTDDSTGTANKTNAGDSNNSTDPRQTMTQKELEQNAEMAKKYPERVVDGIYYADDEALAKARKAYDERLAKEAQQADAQAIAKAQKLAEAMKTINETLYGTDNAEVITQLQGSVGGAELSSILGNAVNVRARQHLLDFTKFKEDFKAANSGKPPHNKDPFPVDQKIEEFETHQPRVKVHDVITHNNGKAAAIMGIMQFDAAEKRIVRLENNMATLMRYLYRLGSRVFINCQYYGGQTTFEKEHIDISRCYCLFRQKA